MNPGSAGDVVAGRLRWWARRFRLATARSVVVWLRLCRCVGQASCAVHCLSGAGDLVAGGLGWWARGFRRATARGVVLFGCPMAVLVGGPAGSNQVTPLFTYYSVGIHPLNFVNQFIPD